MTIDEELTQHVESLKVGEQITIDTDSDIQDRTFEVDRIESHELHVRDGNRHYRVYLRGKGNQKGVGTYVINREFANWPRRQRDYTAPELFYIDDKTSPPGKDERTEGAVEAIR